MNIKLNCLIVDDEPVARKGLEEYVRDIEFLNHAGSCESALKSVSYLDKGNIDLLLLDIHMPKISGIDFLKSLKEPPMVIFTTAYSDYALEGYTLDVIDYLVKPIPFDRFLKAAHKARDFYVLRHKTQEAGPSYFFIKHNHLYEKVNFSDVLYIEAMQNYCIIHLPEKKLITYITFSGLESQLPTDKFLKVHKSFIVAIDKVATFDGNEIIIGKARIPISRSLKEEVMKRIMGDNLLRRS